ncbi:MAG: cysteine--tRNA ligase [Candidatus Aenigmarchaeota archaeon]|nr:cysteine--tRNA ligase [Candidatus Aenigmarchaeota archaeon]
MLKLYNTLARKKQVFRPLKGNEVLLYTCGPTVYDYAHIGNLRAFLFEDLLKRVLLFNSFGVKHVMNLTDVGHLVSDKDEGEDKMIIGAQREHKTAWQVADFYINAFMEDAKKLHIQEPTFWLRATDHIEEMTALVKTLEQKGFTYITNDGIYFDTSKLRDYGKLAKLDIRGLRAGARVEVAEGKRNTTDFALWKFSPPDKKRDMEWDFVAEIYVDDKEYDEIRNIATKNHNVRILDVMNIAATPNKIKKDKTTATKKTKVNFRGFPGWHLECSAMSMKYLGKTIDIHCGGVDHIAVHHTNEIAQSEAATDKKFVRFWLHNEFMLVDGKKMAKSLGNYYTLNDIRAKGFSPLAFRYLCMSVHYRSQMNFTLAALQDAENALQSIKDFIFRLKNLGTDGKKNAKIEAALKKARTNFIKSINDDLDMPHALAALFEIMKTVNKEIDAGKADKRSMDNVYYFFIEINKILDITEEKKAELTPEEKKLIDLREHFRSVKDFRAADEIRRQLKEKGVFLEDTPRGPKWKKV